VATYRESEEAARANGDKRVEWVATVERSTLEFAHFSFMLASDYRPIATEAVRVFEELNDPYGLALAWNLVAWTHNAIGEQTSMLEAGLKACSYARAIGSESLEYQVRAMVGSAHYWGPTATSEAVAYYERDAARNIRSPLLRTMVSFGLGMMTGLAGDVERARSLMEDAVRVTNELGLRVTAASLEGFGLGGLEVAFEDWPAAIAHLRAGADGFLSVGDQGAFSTLAGALALALYEVGELGEAFEYTERSFASASVDDFASQYMWRAARGEVLAARGQAEEALRFANESVAIAEGTEGLMWQADSYMARGEVFRLLGRVEEAAIDFRRALDLYVKKEAPNYIARARRKLAEVTG